LIGSAMRERETRENASQARMERWRLAAALSRGARVAL
jgi:hypothetical protein